MEVEVIAREVIPDRGHNAKEKSTRRFGVCRPGEKKDA